MAVIIPYLRYDDAPAAIEFLTKAFGFEASLVVPDEEGGIAHAQLKFNGGFIMLGSVRADHPAEQSPKSLKGVSGGVYIVIPEDALDAHHQQACKAGAVVIHPLKEQEYGGRAYGVKDLEGQHWSFGSYSPE